MKFFNYNKLSNFKKYVWVNASFQKQSFLKEPFEHTDNIFKSLPFRSSFIIVNRYFLDTTELKTNKQQKIMIKRFPFGWLRSVWKSRVLQNFENVQIKSTKEL